MFVLFCFVPAAFRVQVFQVVYCCIRLLYFVILLFSCSRCCCCCCYCCLSFGYLFSSPNCFGGETLVQSERSINCFSLDHQIGAEADLAPLPPPTHPPTPLRNTIRSVPGTGSSRRRNASKFKTFTWYPTIRTKYVNVCHFVVTLRSFEGHGWSVETAICPSLG